MVEHIRPGATEADPGDRAAEGTAARDATLVQALRARDEVAFRDLVTRHYRAMLRLAMLHVPNRAVAEEVVQDTWLAVLQGLDGFEGRSSLRTWIFHILLNKARTRGVREHRSVPFSTVSSADDAPAVDPDRFLGEDSPWPGHWAIPPRPWGEQPEDRLVAKELRAVVDEALESLPPHQRSVMILRDLEGWPPTDVCHLLDLTPVNERVLLHRARTQVRAALEQHIEHT